MRFIFFSLTINRAPDQSARQGESVAPRYFAANHKGFVRRFVRPHFARRNIVVRSRDLLGACYSCWLVLNRCNLELAVMRAL
jgi:hypothetical protein